jgi:N6-adenosine-specific RNA methylase IME4
MHLFDWPFGNINPHSYDMIMADPPWRFLVRSPKGEGTSAQAHYDTMALEEINALPVMDLAAPNCVLWPWCTAAMLSQQLSTVKAGGFEYCTEGVWVKMTKNGKVSFGTGYGLRGSHEPFTIAKWGEPKLTKSTRSVIHGKAREHSRKPEEAYREAERLMPGASRIEHAPIAQVGPGGAMKPASSEKRHDALNPSGNVEGGF